MKFYKIKNTETGLFSVGGMNPNFTKKGKTWNQFSHVKLHVGNVYPHQYEGCEVIEYEMKETGLTYDAKKMIEDRMEEYRRKAKKEEELEKKRSERIRKERYKELKKEFE